MHTKHIDKIQTKQNHSARLIFFATAYGEHTESALPLLNLFDVLTVHNVYRFQILKFTYLWHKRILPKLFSNNFQYASNIHKYNTSCLLLGRFDSEAGEASELEARETGDEHARRPFPFPSSLARPPLSQRERRLGTRQQYEVCIETEPLRKKSAN